MRHTYAFRSAPAQKMRPSPVTMTTLDRPNAYDKDSATNELEYVPQAGFLLEPVEQVLEIF
jgi:hypothetical protein